MDVLAGGGVGQAGAQGTMLANAQQQVATQNSAQIVSQVAAGQQMSQALFTQEQLNSIVQQRVNQKNAEIAALQQQLNQVTASYQSTFNELNGYKQRDTAIKSGIPANFVDFAVFEANKLAVNGKTFDVAIKEFATANAHLFGSSSGAGQATVTQPATGTVNPQGVSTVVQTVAQAGQQTVPAGQVVSTGQPNQQVQTMQQTQAVGTVGQTAGTGVAGSVQMNGAATVGGSVQQVQGVGGVVQQTLPSGVAAFGGTTPAGMVQPAAGGVASEVDAFLKNRGLKK